MITITDPEMLKKMMEALELSGNVHTLEDIDEALTNGDMQSHSEKDTWVITQVNDFPQKRIVNILYVVGDLEGAFATGIALEKWANDLGADRMIAVGRDGWWGVRTPGWKKVGTLYAKDLNHGQR